MYIINHDDPTCTFNMNVRISAQRLHYGFSEKEAVETLANDQGISQSEAYLLVKAAELYMKF